MNGGRKTTLVCFILKRAFIRYLVVTTPEREESCCAPRAQDETHSRVAGCPAVLHTSKLAIMTVQTVQTFSPMTNRVTTYNYKISTNRKREFFIMGL